MYNIENTTWLCCKVIDDHLCMVDSGSDIIKLNSDTDYSMPVDDVLKATY